VVNLRPETDPETECVSSDRPRALARIMAELDEAKGVTPMVDVEEAKGEDEAARGARRRKQPAKTDPPPKRLSARQGGTAPWAALGPPSRDRR